MVYIESRYLHDSVRVCQQNTRCYGHLLLQSHEQITSADLATTTFHQELNVSTITTTTTTMTGYVTSLSFSIKGQWSPSLPLTAIGGRGPAPSNRSLPR